MSVKKRRFRILNLALACAFLAIYGCGKVRAISDEKWSSTSIATEADAIEAFGEGVTATDSASKQMRADYNLSESTVIRKWSHSKDSAVFFYAAFEDGKVVKQMRWNSAAR